MFDAVVQQAADPVERVVLVTAVTEGVLLDAATNLVDDLGAELDDVEGVMPTWSAFGLVRGVLGAVRSA